MRGKHRSTSRPPAMPAPNSRPKTTSPVTPAQRNRANNWSPATPCDAVRSRDPRGETTTKATTNRGATALPGRRSCVSQSFRQPPPMCRRRARWTGICAQIVEPRRVFAMSRVKGCSRRRRGKSHFCLELVTEDVHLRRHAVEGRARMFQTLPLRCARWMVRVAEAAGIQGVRGA